jgi:hypothetical protein
MKRLLALLFAYASVEAKSIVTDEYLDKVAMVESNYNYESVGDKGKAIGAWQMHEPAWRESCQRYARKDCAGFSPWDDLGNNHKKFATDPVVSRLVAKMYLQILETQMNNSKIKVTPIALYMAYNMGFQGAYNKDFNFKSFYLDNKRKGILARANQILSR